MAVNWKVRVQSKPFIIAVLALIGFVLVDNNVIDFGKWEIYCELFLAVVISGGIVVDPTTPGLSDSKRALGYDKPGVDTDKDTYY